MHHAVSQPGQSAQRSRRIQIARQGRDTQCTQLIDATLGCGERHQANAPWQSFRHPQPDITATHDQNTRATKTCR
jgi:hypothetical protein